MSAGPSVPAKVLLQNRAMVSPGGFYRKGTKAHAKACADLRVLAAAIIAAGCLTACGGGGVDDETSTVSPVEVLSPALQAGDLAQPATAVPGAPGVSPSPSLNVSRCRAPQASEQGQAHGKPPMERCE